MSKKIVAMLMAVAMAFSLLPVTAFATGGPQEGNSQPVTNSENNLTMNKTVTPKGDGTYTVQLESYATGSVIPTQAPVPMDFVLVLDVSGSMTDEIASYGYQPTEKTSWSARDIYYAHTTYYAKIGDEYYPVSYGESGKWYSKSYWLEANGQPLGDKGSWNAKVYNGPLYTYSEVPDTKTTKLAAMKTAVNNFIESVAAQKNGDDPVAHRISIVKFAGKSNDGVGNDTYPEDGFTYNYTQKVTELTDVTAAGSVASLKRDVNALTAGGATRADLGMEKADGVLNGRQDAEKDRPSVVIMFTDGEPTKNTNFSWNVAGAAVDTAKTLKAGGTKVYTIGMFTDADPSDTNGAFNKYMNGVSSKYPDAVGTKKNNKKDYNGIYLGTCVDGNYYFKADNAGDLEQVFQKISQSTTVTSPLDDKAVVVDNVPSNFALNEGSVKVYTENCIAKNGETFKWDTKTESTIRPTIEDQSISVTGFNFSKNWCGLDENNQACGQKLIIEFTIKCTNYGGTQRTNAGAYIKANAGSTDRIIWVDDPEVPVTVQLPGVNNPAVKTKPYDGAGFDIKDEIGKIIAGLVPVDGIKNQFIDLTYEIKDSSGKKVGTYTIPAGETTGTWNSNEEIKTDSDADTYNYTITVTGQDKKQTSNNDSKECTATFTIKERDVTFTGKSDSLTWTGDEQTITDITAPTDLVPGHTYEGGLNYVAKGTDTGSYDGVFTGTAIIKDATGIDVTANYNVKTKPGTLTITNSTSTATVTFKIVGGKWSDDTAEDKTVQVTLTNGKGSLAGVTIPIGSPSEDYTGAGTWSSSDENITGAPAETTEITKDTTFTLAYSKIEPVVTNVDVTFKIVGGKWFDGTTNPITKSVQLTDGKGSLAGVEIPTGVADADHQENGTWSPAIPKAETVITQDGDKVFTLTFQRKEEQKPSDPVKWDVSCSKIASGLMKNSNGDWTTNVTLSLPSAEEKLESDVVFVLDGSSSADTDVVKQSLSLLDQLKQAVDGNNAAVNVCVVKFKRQAFKSNWYDLSKDFGAIKTDMETKYSGGTNLHAGLLAGKEALEEHSKVSANRKYLILVSDGSTYLYSKDGNWKSDTPFTRSYHTKENYTTSAGGFWDNGHYEPNNYPEVNVPRPKDTSDVAAWKAYLEDVEERNAESNGDEYDYHCNYDLNFNQGIPSDDFKSQPCVKRSANNRDMAFYYADQTWQEMKEDGYHLFSIATEDGSAGAGNADDSHCFMNYLNEGKSLTFSEIQNEVIYAVSAGSTVTDIIGSKFSFEGIKSLTVGKQELTATKSGENTWYFGNDNTASESNYLFKVVYNSQDHQFVWTINESVSNFAPVQLTYTVKLTKPETAAGTYGVTDLNGDGKVDGTDTTYTDTDALYTNESATMVPKDSDWHTGEKLTFPKPSVSYTVSSGNSGSHSGGSRPSLNTKDHYGYIIGYPVDYYTGQPTTDQTKKPVRPEGKITRAEVATIYFRMLTDESRTKFWSQNSGYSDVKAGDWFNNAVSTLSKAGIIAGYEDGSFRPNGYITRAEFATIAARFFDVTYNGKDLFPDISGHWAKDYINQAANKGFVNGYEDGTFKPDRNITRAEAVTLVNRTLDRHPDKNHFTKDMLVWPDNMDQTKWYYADMQEATNSHTYQMKENSDKTKYENWTKTLPIRNWEALEKAWSNANSSQGNGNVV